MDRMIEHKRLYKIFRGLVRMFSHPMKVVWEEPYDGTPSVFCPNHAGMWGPVDVCAHFDLRDNIRPWYNADVADPKKVPAYVRQDYWWKPGCALEPLYNATLPYLAAAVLPPILNSTDGIQVHHDAKVVSTFRQSVDAIARGENLVIFPEQPADHKVQEEKLNEGWLLLGTLLYKKLGVKMRVYPVHIDHRHHVIHVRKPITYQPEVPMNDQKDAFLSAIAEGLKD